LKAKGKHHHHKNKESKTSNKVTTSSNKMASISNKVTSKSKVGTWVMTNNKGNGVVAYYGILKCTSQGCFFNIALD
jgi:hypothetical protein